jgi:hypothetical protein
MNKYPIRYIMSTYFKFVQDVPGLVTPPLELSLTTLLETFLGLAQEFLRHLKAGI